ncbi:hypothetical protein [Krasilnikovia sp. M28-CT-15]|uniref:hypothetical protein n=1 Tax=Krasilnikovia sp. M28-CT-15 TaxID=3373540 RepID=UPI003875C597
MSRDGLARRYGRWLRFYPPGPRRAEMLGTLLECAPPNRTRPTAREAVNLMRFGLRARLGRPASRSVVVLATMVTLTAGLVGAAGAATIGWALAPALPAGAPAETLKATVFPGLRVWGGGDAEPFVPAAGADGGVRYGYADYWVRNTAAAADLPAYTRGVHDRLAAAGWQIHRGTHHDNNSLSPEFWATRDGLTLTYFVQPSDDASMSFTVSRATPPWLAWLAGAGAALAAVAGWLLFGWASRRSEGHHLRTAGGATLTWLAVLVGLLIPLLAAWWYPTPNPPEGEVLWADLEFWNQGPGLLALLLAAGALIAAALAPRIRAITSAALVLVAVGAMTTVSGVPSWAQGTCAPSGPPAEPPAGDVARSRLARIYLSRDITDQQRAVVEAASWRVWAVNSTSFHSDPADEAYRYAYCDGRRLAGGSRQDLPSFWEIDLTSAGGFPALAAEVSRLPGVVAVRHARP